MHRPKLHIATLWTLMLSASGQSAETQTTAQPLEARPDRAAIQADPERIRAHVKFLAGGSLEGRVTGQRGAELAADYIARQFVSYGLRPAGDNGTYFQAVPLVEVQTLDGTAFALVSTSLETTTLKPLEDFVTSNESQTESAYIDAPIVFVGYGIKAPEYDWDDYKEADLNGKVALLLADEPKSDDPKFFRGKALTYYGGSAYKFQETARRGAVAALIIHPGDRASDSWQSVRDFWGTKRAYLKTDGTPRVRAASWIQLGAAQKLAALAGVGLDKLLEQAQSKNFHPVELPVRLQAHVASHLRPFVSRNVLAALPSPGSNSQEAVLYTAHYDHWNVAPTQRTHNADHGTLDEATGCGVLLEVARIWSRTPRATPRSILFAALTAEDQGLLGSDYLAKHSPVPPGKVSMDLNYDAVYPTGDPEVVVSGAERTNFYPAVEDKAKTLALIIRPDSHPEAGSYYRSSPFSFARVGIPSFSIEPGWQFTHGDHQPTDEHLPQMDFAGGARLAMLGYELGAQASSQLNLVAWVPGDEFEAERRRSQLLNRKAQATHTAKPRKPHKS